MLNLGLLGKAKWFTSAVKATKAFKALKFIGTIAFWTTGVKGFLQMREMLNQGQAIMANKRAAGGKIPVIYGTRRVGTQIVYLNTFGKKNRDLYVVYALSVGECEEILGKTIEIDGNSILDEKIFKKGGYVGSDKITTGAGSLCTADQNGDTNAGVGGGLGTDPTKRYQFVFNLHHGADSQTADPMLTASIPSDWTSDHKLNGICYIAAHFHYSKTGVFQGIPNITVQVKGKKVYDPRESGHTFGDASTYEWSSNPALCYLDYITNDEYGKGLAEADINMSTFETAADTCDVLVDQPYYNGAYQNITWSGTSGDDFVLIGSNTDWYQNKTDEVVDIRDNGGTNVFSGTGIKGVQRHQFYDDSQVNKVFIDGTLSSDYTNEAGSFRAKVKRFHCNGLIDTNRNVMDNAKELLANMRGIFTYIDGKYELQIEDTGSSTFSITEDHIIADEGISVDYGNKDKKANKVVIEFYNSQLNYELDTATVLHDATPNYYSDDGEILEIKAQFPLVTDAYIAYNMGKAILTRSRNQISLQFLGTPEMYKLNVGDIVDVTYAGLGFSGKICRVESLELQSNGLVNVSLIEYFDVYTWEVPAEEDTRKLTKLPTKGAINPPDIGTIVFTDTDASAINRPTLTWTEPDDFDVKEFRVDVVDSSDNNVFSKIVDTPSVDLSFLPKASNYEASITSFNTLGVESESVTKTFTIADDPVKTTEVEIDGVTLSTVEAYGVVSGKTGNWLKFLNKANFAEIVEYDNGFIVNGGTGQFENAAIFVDGATSRGELFIDDGHIRFDSNTPSDTTNKLYNVAGTLYWNGNSINTAAGDITAVVAGTNLNGGGTSGSVTLNLDSTITGDHTFSDNVIISGDLTVNGTTTTVNTNDLNVKDKNITLNYSTGDSSATANGAGITIQDAVNSTTDATILWTTANDTFNFSHPVSVTGNITSSNTVTSQSINVNSSGYGFIEVGGVSGAYIDLKSPNTDDYDLRLISFGTGGEIDTGSGDLVIKRQGSTRISTTSTGIDVTGTVTADGLTVDGNSSLLTFDNGSNPATISNTNGNITTDFDTINAGRNYTIQANSINAFRIANGGDISFYEDTGTTAKLFWDASAERLGIGTSSASGELHVSNASDFYVDVDGTDSAVVFKEGGGNSWRIGNRASGDKFNITQSASSLGTNVRFTIDNGGNVGIGTVSPNADLHLRSALPDIKLEDSNDGSEARISYNTAGNNGLIISSDEGNEVANSVIAFRVDASEKARLNHTGDLLVGKTSTAVTNTGIEARNNGLLVATRGGAVVSVLNRETTDGDIAQYRKDNTTIGSIGVAASNNLYIGAKAANHAGLYFSDNGTNGVISPMEANTLTSSSVDLGSSTYKFKHLYLSGDVIANGDITADGDLQVDNNAQIDGNLGIGGAASAELHIQSASPEIRFTDTDTLTNTGKITYLDGRLVIQSDDNNQIGSSTIEFQIDNSEKSRIISDGNFLIGKTSANNTDTGIRIDGGNKFMSIVRAGNPCVILNRTVSDGVIMQLRRGTTTSGQIGITDSAVGFVTYFASGNSSSTGTGLKFISVTGATSVSPCRGDGSSYDNAVDLGSSSVRFDDVYATNGTIQTSDRSEKQDIQELSDAEQRVAVACKGLIRRYKFNSAVEEKGDDARYHFGIIAQDLQDAFTAEGLDASDYGMFISNTWTDEEGNEQTRLGVRYNELLAFIIATL